MVLSSCNNTNLLFDSELRELKFEYDELVEKKKALEEELALLEEKYNNYPRNFINTLYSTIKNNRCKTNRSLSYKSWIRNNQ